MLTKKRLHEIGLWTSLWNIVLMNNCCCRAQSFVCGAIPGLVDLSYVQQQTESGEQVSSDPS